MSNMSGKLSSWLPPAWSLLSRDPLATLDLSPKEIRFPAYFLPRDAVVPWLSDKYLSLLLPILCYWGFSLVYQAIDTWQHPFFEKYRIHEPEEVTKRNRVSKSKVIRMVVLQQLIQTALGILVLDDDTVGHQQVFSDHREQMRAIGVRLARVVVGVAGMKRGMPLLDAYGTQVTEWLYWWGIPIAQFWFAFLVMDAWQYFWHRAFHESRFLYRNFHSHHHRLYVPYAFGALYNHPLEGLILDSLGAAIAHACALMTVRQGIGLFAFSTLKTVDDHGGYAFPWWIDPLHLVFPNTAEYHDVHHQMQGLRYNYSQPFFVHFDAVLGTRMSAEKFKKMKELQASKKEALAAKQAAADETAAKTTAVPQVTNPAASLRKRDAAPADIVNGTSDPFATHDAASYKAKAGTAVS